MASTFSEKLQDPICETTRKQKRNLLIFSLLGIVIAKARIFPTEITALGVKFSHGDSASILSMLSWIILYYLITFVIYSWSEFVALRIWSIEKEEEYRKALERSGGMEERYRHGIFGSLALRFRTYFEFLVPIIISVTAIVWLWAAEPPPISQNEPVKTNTEQKVQVGLPPPSAAP